jgi:hypothetical protein
VRAHEIVDQRIARAGIAGDRIAAVDKSDVGDAAHIEHSDRMRPLEIARQRLMERRHQRRALPAGRHVGGAEIICNGNAETARQRFAVADLNGQPLPRPVQYGLAMETDDGHIRFVDMLGVKKGLHGLGVHPGDEVVGLGQHARARGAVGQCDALRKRLPQQGLLVVRIGPVAARAEMGDALAIGLDQRHIDAVERGPAHQPNGPNHPHSLTPFCLRLILSENR